MKIKEGLVHTTPTKNAIKEQELGQPIGLICLTNNMSMMVCSFCKPTIEFNEILSLINHIKDFHGFILNYKIISNSLFGIKEEEFSDEKFKECQRISLSSGFNKISKKHDEFCDDILSKPIGNETSTLSSKGTVLNDYQQIITTKFGKNVEAIEIHPKQFYCTNCKSNFKLRNELLEHVCSYGASKSKTFHRSANLSSKRILDIHLHRQIVERNHKCHYCQKRFNTSTGLRNHLTSHTLQRNFKCEYCGESFRTSILVWRHKKRSHQEQPNIICRQINPFKYIKDQQTINDDGNHLHHQIKQETTEIQSNEFHCNQCGMDLKLEDKLGQHICLNTQTFQCAKCDRSFISKHSYNNHMRIHSDRKRRSCEFCHLSFNTIDLLKEHMSNHAGERYKCKFENCDRSYSLKSSLVYHYRSHTGEKPFKCKLCPLAYHKSFSLVHHMTKHTGERYRCDYENCNRSYSLKSSLDSHKRTHTGEKPFKCKLCPLEFHRSVLLHYHMANHTGKRYKCEYENCDRSYLLKSSLVSHIRSHTGEKPFKCKSCPLAFHNKFLLKQHMTKHTGERFKCEYENCDRSYSRKSDLISHNRIHTGEKPYTCELCSVAFNRSDWLKSHMAKHTGNRFKCEFENCNRSYLYKSSLKNHIKSHDKEKQHKC